MNKIFRIVFNRETGRWVVASEIAKGRKKQGSGGATAAAVLLTGSLGGLMAVSSPSYAAVVVNGNPQEATVGCELITDSGTTTWTATTATGSCLAPSLAGTASGQGNPGTDAIFYSSGLTNGTEDSLNLGGYLDVWKTATFHSGIDMSMQRITNLANGQGDYDAVNVLQLKGALQGLGGGAGINVTNGQVYTPSYTLANANAIAGTSGAATDVGMGFTKVDAALGKLNTSVYGGGGIKYFHVNSALADSVASGANAVAIGPAATTSGGNAVVIGNGANTVSGNAVAMGNNSKVVGAGSVAIGDSSYAFSTGTALGQSVALGASSNASGDYSTAVGGQALATNNAASAFGVNANASGQRGVAVGASAAAAGSYATAIGTLASAGAANSTALGTSANASAVNSVALGANSTTTATLTNAAYNPGSAALSGTASVANGEVSIGKSGSERRLTNLAAGSAATDAVNVSQLQAEDATVDQQGTDTAARLGGGSTYSATTGAISAPSHRRCAQADRRRRRQRGCGQQGRRQRRPAVHDQPGRGAEHDRDRCAGRPHDHGRRRHQRPRRPREQQREGSVNTITNQLSSGEIGLVQYDAAAQSVTVAKGLGGATVDFRNNSGVARRLKGVAAGAQDEDAANVAQLKNALGGTASYDPATGAYTGPVYTVTNADGSTSQVNGVGGAIDNIDARVYNNTTQIQNVSTQISSGTIGLVQQAGAGAKLTVGKDTGGTEVDFASASGAARSLTNVADGDVAAGSKDAVNGGQLHTVSTSVASAIGGGAQVNADGTVSAPTFNLSNADGTTTQVHSVGDAVTQIDGRVAKVEGGVATLSSQLEKGEVGLVKQDATTRQISVAKDSDGTSVSVAGTAGDRVITGVAAAKADNDAVNLGQLKAAGVLTASGESKSVMTYDNADKTSMTLGGTDATAPVAVHNVADGVADHDAVNVSQLNERLTRSTTEVVTQANAYTDQRFDDVWAGMDQVARKVMEEDRRINQHGAMSMAQAQMASGAAAAAVGNPNGAWSVGLGFEKGYGAISAGYAKPVGKKSQISFGAAFSGDERSVGMGFAHKL